MSATQTSHRSDLFQVDFIPGESDDASLIVESTFLVVFLTHIYVGAMCLLSRETCVLKREKKR